MCATVCLSCVWVFACVLVVKTAWLYRASIWQDLKRLWDMQGFINNHWPHEKLIHSGLENRHCFPCRNHVDVRKTSFKIIPSLLVWHWKIEEVLSCCCFSVHMCIKDRSREKCQTLLVWHGNSTNTNSPCKQQINLFLLDPDKSTRDEVRVVTLMLKFEKPFNSRKN